MRPKIRSVAKKKEKEIPENLWQKCAGCGEMLFHRDYASHNNVCHHCGHHGRLPAKERLALLFGENYTEVELPKFLADPLKFKDRKKYTDRHKEAQQKTRRRDAIIIGRGLIGGMPMVAAVFDFEFMAGSMGTAVGEGIVAAAKAAIDHKATLLIIPASGGARMQEGILSLMQMARTTIAVQQVREAGLPYFVLLTDPTTGGVTASFAMLGDITFAEPGCVIGFAGKRVIEETIREKLPEGFQTAEYLLERGMVDRIIKRNDQVTELAKAAALLLNRQPVTSAPMLQNVKTAK